MFGEFGQTEFSPGGTEYGDPVFLTTPVGHDGRSGCIFWSCARSRARRDFWSADPPRTRRYLGVFAAFGETPAEEHRSLDPGSSMNLPRERNNAKGSTMTQEFTINILYFAVCRDIVGASEEQIRIRGGATISDVLSHIGSIHPNLCRVLPSVRCAINREFVAQDAPVSAGDEVALVPPVSGGAPVVERFVVAAEPILAHSAVDLLDDPPGKRGALATFVGIVRADSRSKSIEHLEYQAYVPMALAQMVRIEAEVRSKWEILSLAIVHRVGLLAVGEVAVSIAVSSEHRAPAMDACRYVIERLKQDVPIWKKEVATDGSEWWGRGS